MATDRIINQTQGDEIITALIAIKNAINDQPVPTTVEDVVAAEFSDGVSYTVGQYVIKDGLMYKCTTAHHGAWNGSDFTLTTTGAQLTELNSALTNKCKTLKITGNIVPVTDSTRIGGGWNQKALSTFTGYNATIFNKRIAMFISGFENTTAGANLGCVGIQAETNVIVNGKPNENYKVQVTIIYNE